MLENKDPVTERRVNRATNAACTDNTFRTVAQDWLAMKQKEWSAGHYTKSARAFERDIYPALGKLPIASITPSIVAKAVENIHKRDVLETDLSKLFLRDKERCSSTPVACIGSTPARPT